MPSAAWWRHHAPELYADGGLWERDLWAARPIVTLSLSRWVRRHCEPESPQVERTGVRVTPGKGSRENRAPGGERGRCAPRCAGKGGMAEARHPDQEHVGVAHHCRCDKVSRCRIFTHPSSIVQAALNQLMDAMATFDEDTEACSTLVFCSTHPAGVFTSVTRQAEKT